MIENEPPPFAPASPPPFPEVQTARPRFGRRKLAALAGVIPLGAVAIGSTTFLRNPGDAHSVAAQAATTASTSTNTPTASAASASTLATRTAPAADLAPEISRIGSRHIAALHSIHNYINHTWTYHPQALDEYFAGAIDSATGAHRQQLIDTQRATRDYLFATNSRSEVIEFNCGLRAINGTTALGIGYVKQSSTSDLAPNPALCLIATVVTAEEQPDGRWLISDLQRIST
ncbi:hypothetical protein ACFYO1_16850 [Nocardia sp. NPDC006044]|uniref:hypothetical protein n=1 Tax=Nocardia sp. NPDC006044 TaxID=3364306 RepID=UPI0036CC6EAF